MKANIVRGLIAIAALYHVGIGIMGLFLPASSLVRVTQVCFGVAVEPDAQFMLAARFAVAYMLAFGGLCLVYASNPSKFRLLGFPAALLFALRGINRVVQFNALAALGLSTPRNVIGIALLFGFAIVMLIPLFAPHETTEAQ